MKLIRGLFFLTLGLLAGCGGCDSCFGTEKPGDVVPSATPAPPPIPTKTFDAAVQLEETPSTHDSGAPAPVVVPTVSAVPRPSNAPMPLGAFQSCGVYDGPRCEKACDKGNCRQECDGVDCELTCKGGWCSQVCGAQATCRLTCGGGHCVQVCTQPEGCVKECAGGGCQ